MKDAVNENIMPLDRFDLEILAHLQKDASGSAAEIGAKVGLSQSQCWRRIERLEQEGVILKRVALVDRKKVGLDTMIFAQVKLKSHGHAALMEFSKAISKYPEVQECHVLLGSMDFLLRIVTRDMDSYKKFFFESLSELDVVREVHSMIAMSEIKSSTALPLGPSA